MRNEQIWAPWRLGYVQQDKSVQAPDNRLPGMLEGADPGCFLCRAVVSEDNRRDRIVYRGQHCITVLNHYPYNNGHLLIAPQRHWANLADLSAEVHQEVSQTLIGMVAILKRILRPQGFNVGLNLGEAAGAGLPGHLHWHLVPRWIGDTSFMSVAAGVNVIPQSLEALWEAITAELPACREFDAIESTRPPKG